MNAHKKTDLILEEVESAYEKFYKKKQAQIKKDFDSYFKQFTKQDEKKRLQVERGELTEKEYNLWRKRKMAQGKEYKQMQERIAIDLYNVNQIATQYVNNRLAEVYSVNYNAVESATMQLKGYSFNLVNEKVVKALAEEDKSLLPFKQLDPDKDIPWNMRNINNAISEGIRKGESIPEISKRIYGDVAKDTAGLQGKELKSVLKKNKEAAVRSARTIVTGAENKARLDSYHDLEKQGVILKKQWSAVIDGRTRDWHAELDGQIRELDEPFENAMGEIMFPGDPSADPSNYYNCRCTMDSIIVGFRSVKK